MATPPFGTSARESSRCIQSHICGGWGSPETVTSCSAGSTLVSGESLPYCQVCINSVGIVNKIIEGDCVESSVVYKFSRDCQ